MTASVVGFASAENSGNTTFTITLPAGSAAGDLCVVAALAPGGLSVPDEFTQIGTVTSTFVSSNSMLLASSKVLDADDISAGTVTMPAPGFTLQRHSLWVVTGHDGVDASAFAGASTISSDTTVPMPAATATVDDVLVLRVGGGRGHAGSPSWTSTPDSTDTPAGSVDDYVTPNTVVAMYAGHHTLASAGSTGTASAQTDGDFIRWVAGTIVIASAAGEEPVDLVVEDLAVASTIDAPTLTQVHGLTVAGLLVAATIGAPTLTQVHNLAVEDVTVASTIDTVALTQDHQLAIEDLTVATTIDTVALTVEGDLQVADLSVATTVDTVTLTQVHNLTVADLSVAPTIGTVAITQVHTLNVEDLTVATAIGSVELVVGAVVLTVENLSVAPTIDTVALTQTHVLTVDDLTVASTIDDVALTQVHTLAVDGLAVAVTADSVTLSVGSISPALNGDPLTTVDVTVARTATSDTTGRSTTPTDSERTTSV